VFLDIITTDSVRMFLVVEAYVQLRGRGEEPLVERGYTNVFTVFGRRTVSSRDFAPGGSGDIKIQDHDENEPLRKDLEDYAQRFPTAPVGTYRVTMKALPASAFSPLNLDATPLGTPAQKRIIIQNASVGEVQVTLVDPQEGAVIPTTLPTFSWNSEKPDVTLYIYEKQPIHQSPEEAISGIPHLKLDLPPGSSTFTYPATAPRRLEIGKGYYWFVETSVSTNRGIQKRQSEIRFFRIMLDNPWAQVIERVFGNLGGGAAGTLATLQSTGWLPKGAVTLDGRPMTREEFAALINSIAENKRPLQIRVESD
jgi:hypothetical protein